MHEAARQGFATESAAYERGRPVLSAAQIAFPYRTETWSAQRLG